MAAIMDADTSPAEMSGHPAANGSRGSPSGCSKPFRRAAIAERDKLARRLERLRAKAERQRGELSATEAQADDVENQIVAICELAGIPARGGSDPSPVAAAALTGRAIRLVAVKVLLQRGLAEGPIHYRQWLELVEKAGHEVAGKRPDAVFLNQLVRSPVVRAAGRAGFYEVNSGALAALHEMLSEARGALRELAGATPATPEQLAEHSARVRELSLAVGRAQRRLEEAREVLGASPADAPARGSLQPALAVRKPSSRATTPTDEAKGATHAHDRR